MDARWLAAKGGFTVEGVTTEACSQGDEWSGRAWPMMRD